MSYATIASRSPSRFRARATASTAWSSIIARASRSFRGCCPIPAVEFNFTYAPSNTGERDLAGNKIPFQDNSTESGNAILWYQNQRFQTRVAYNYRSKRAVMENVGGIAGMEEYEAPQNYLDASIAYKVSKYAEVFVNGSNLTNEYQRYYLVWPDQPAHSNFSERMLPVRRPRAMVIGGPGSG